MTDVNASGDAAQESKLATETQVQSPSEGLESSAVAGDSALNNVAGQSSEGSSQDKDIAWYEERNKQLSAESARRREKAKKQTEELEKAKARIEELEKNRPTEDQFGGDFDKFQNANQEHMLRRVIAEEKLQDIAKPVTHSNDAVQKANEQYIKRIEGYFGQEGAVNPQAYQAKEVIFDDALSSRTEDEQAIIIRELSVLDNPAEALMNVVDNPKALYEVSTGKSLYDVISAIRNAKPVIAKQEAPAPVPDIGGSTGEIGGEYDRSTKEGARRYFADLKAGKIK